MTDTADQATTDTDTSILSDGLRSGLLEAITTMAEESGIEIPEEGVDINDEQLASLFVSLTNPVEGRRFWEGWNDDTYEASNHLARELFDRLRPFTMAIDALHEYDGLALHPRHVEVLCRMLEHLTSTLTHQLSVWQAQFIDEPNFSGHDTLAGAGHDDEFCSWLSDTLDDYITVRIAQHDDLLVEFEASGLSAEEFYAQRVEGQRSTPNIEPFQV